MNWYIEVLKKYVVFTGRARRKEFWMFALFNFLIMLVLSVLENMMGLAGDSGRGPISMLYSLAVLLPGLGVTVRRLHDIGKSGWWVLIYFIPCIGWLVMLFFTVQDSQPGANEHGPNPKGE